MNQLLALAAGLLFSTAVSDSDINPAPSPQTLPVQHRAAPYVVSASPTGDRVTIDSTVVLLFSDAMSRSSVENTFDIQPRADGSVTWLNDWTFRFQPFRLAHAMTYEMHVSGRSLRGLTLRGKRSWRFTTEAGPPIEIAPGRGAIRVPILMYHYIRVNPDPRDRMGYALSVTPGDFAAQMDWLARSGYHPISLGDLYAYLVGAAGLPSRPVVLTFDDGYSDFYTTALPVLIRHDFKAVAYVVPGFLGRGGYMTQAQVQQADRAGIEIGSHTVDHVNLTRQSEAGLRYQLTASKGSLEDLLGHPVYAFCYPYGRVNWAVAAAVQAAGYRDATTTDFGALRSLDGRYVWGRLRVNGGEDLLRFASDVQSVS